MLRAVAGTGPLANALEAQALLFLTDVPGVKGADGEVVSRLGPTEYDDMRTGGVLKSGMLPKVAAALAALAASPKALGKIAPAAGDDANRRAHAPRPRPTWTALPTAARVLMAAAARTPSARPAVRRS